MVGNTFIAMNVRLLNITLAEIKFGVMNTAAGMIEPMVASAVLSAKT